MRNSKWMVVLALAAVWALVIAWFAVAAHEALLTQMNDLGNLDQALWAASNGDWAMVQSNDVDGRIKSRLAVHLNVLFYPLAIVYLFAADPAVLLPLSAIGCAIAACGIFAYARLTDASWWSVAAPLAFLAHPMVHDAAVYEFKIVTLATAALVWSVWAFDTGRTRLGCGLATFILLAQEDLALLVISLGLYLVLTKRRRLGLVMMAIAVAYLAIMLGVVVPMLNAGEGLAKVSGAGSRVAWLRGANVVEIFATMLRPDRLRLPIYLLLSGAIVALRAWRLLVIALPIVIGALVANTQWMSQLTGTYYHVPVIAMIVLAAASLGRFAWPLVASIVFSFALSPLPHSAVASWDNYPRRGAEVDTLRSIAMRLPPDAAISVQNNLGPWVAHRRDVAAYPRRIATADFVLLQLRRGAGPNRGVFPRYSTRVLLQLPPQALVSDVEALLRSNEWTLVLLREGFYLFRRGGGGTRDARVFAQFARDRDAFLAECREADAHRSRFATLLVGRYGWRELSAALRTGSTPR